MVNKIKDRLDLLDGLPKGGQAVEVGVHKAEYAQHILHRAQPKHLYLIDPWQHQDMPKYQLDCTNVSQSQQETIYRQVKEMFQGKPVSIIRKYSAQAAMDFADNSLDFIYLDACHLHDYVLTDMVLWWSKLKPGGMLAGHDYVTGHPWIETVTAVDSFCRIFKTQLALLTQEHYASWAIFSHQL